MEVRVSLLMQSHLSDALFEMSLPNRGLASERLEFVKWMVHMFPDTNVKVDADVVYKQFKLKQQVNLEN
jgi:hypothetical protein